MKTSAQVALDATRLELGKAEDRHRKAILSVQTSRSEVSIAAKQYVSGATKLSKSDLEKARVSLQDSEHWECGCKVLVDSAREDVTSAERAVQLETDAARREAYAADLAYCAERQSKAASLQEEASKLLQECESVVIRRWPFPVGAEQAERNAFVQDVRKAAGLELRDWRGMPIDKAAE